ncbi:MAG: OmpH family outer membrane protein [Proteobacteria bacterium]|nr:OmpH family outer membrane protein [Pseudomonadota bacterium]
MKPNLCDSVSVRGSRTLTVIEWVSGLRQKIAALALVGAVIVCATVPAWAEAIPKLEPVAVIDFRNVLSKSDAALSIRKTVDGRREAFREKFAQIEKQLREEQQTLAQQRPIITADAFEQRARDLKSRARQAQIEAQASNQQLKRAFDTAMDVVQKELFRVVAELAEETGAGIVLFRSSIVIAVKKLEISQEALARLNKKVSKVDVVFEPAKKK